MARCAASLSLPTPRLRALRASPMRSHTILRVYKPKEVWLSTTCKEVLTTALEAGLAPASALLTLLFEQSHASLAQDWQPLGRFRSLYTAEGGRLVDETGQVVGELRQLAGPEDLRAAEAAAPKHKGVFVMDATDWQVIPAENLVAAFQAQPQATLLAVAPDSRACQTFLEALETGCGVVLRTEDPGEVRRLAAYLEQRQREAASQLQFEAATVTAVEPRGMGDRACVDCACLMRPGEGLLVGNFARALFLVHSECAETSYISSRPFRVNAGPVHAYVQRPDERTAYLSELQAGSEVLVVDPEGRQRSALVGRVKIEARPLVLVQAATADGQTHSILLQNAETVKLVGPAEGSVGSSSSPASSSSSSSSDPAGEGFIWQEGRSGGSSAGTSRGSNSCGDRSSSGQSWRAISVSELQPGDRLLLFRQAAARHTGVSIEEQITEK